MNRRHFLTGATGLVISPSVLAGEASEWIEIIDLDGARVRLLVNGAHQLASDVLIAHVRSCVQAVAAWYGRFPTPVSEVQLTIRGAGHGWGHGRAFGGQLPRVKVGMGAGSTLADLQSDWVFVHELVHLACPMVSQSHHWLEEGLSTYVEPWIRVPMGEVSPEKAWWDLVKGLPQGQPGAADSGLDRTPTWGRTYWGGALFCLLVDVGLRRRNPEVGLQQAFQGLIGAGGGMHEFASMGDLMDRLDGHVGGKEFRGVWEAHRHDALTVDLDALWKELGVQIEGRGVTLVDAPGAAIRRQICPE